MIRCKTGKDILIAVICFRPYESGKPVRIDICVYLLSESVEKSSHLLLQQGDIHKIITSINLDTDHTISALRVNMKLAQAAVKIFAVFKILILYAANQISAPLIYVPIPLPYFLLVQKKCRNSLSKMCILPGLGGLCRNSDYRNNRAVRILIPFLVPE